MFGLYNGYLIGKNDETGEIYMFIEVSDPKKQEELKQINNNEVK